jgi:hypothetical protein
MPLRNRSSRPLFSNSGLPPGTLPSIPEASVLATTGEDPYCARLSVTSLPQGTTLSGTPVTSQSIGHYSATGAGSDRSAHSVVKGHASFPWRNPLLGFQAVVPPSERTLADAFQDYLQTEGHNGANNAFQPTHDAMVCRQLVDQHKEAVSSAKRAADDNVSSTEKDFWITEYMLIRSCRLSQRERDEINADEQVEGGKSNKKVRWYRLRLLQLLLTCRPAISQRSKIRFLGLKFGVDVKRRVGDEACEKRVRQNRVRKVPEGFRYSR